MRMVGMPAERRFRAALRSSVGGVLGAGALAGCVTAYEGKYAFSEGWREVRVESVGSRSDMGKWARTDCRMRVRDKDALFIRVTYPFSARMRLAAIIPASADKRPIPGEIAFANIRTCEFASASR